MKIIQFNATSIRNKLSSIAQYLHTNDIAVACICESFLNSDDVINIKNYSIVRSDRCSSLARGGGVLIAVRKDLKFKQLCVPPSSSPIEVCICEVSSSSINFCVVSTYIPPNINFSDFQLDNILNCISHNNILFCGDFNAHHISWGCSRIDTRGRRILNLFENRNLVLLNDGSMTYFGSSQSALDLTFCSPSLSLRASWTATNDTLGSSHCIVLTKIIIGVQVLSNPTLRIPRHLNKSLLNSKLKEIFSSPNFSFDYFVQQFRNTFQSANVKKKVNPNPWWNIDCTKANELQNLALQAYRRLPSRENYSNLKEAQKSYKYIIRLAKREGWKNFCSNLNSDMSVGEFWRIIKRFKGSPKNAEIGLRDCISTFCDSLAGPCGPIKPPDIVDVRQDHFLTQPFSFPELERAITHSKNSAPGPDGICNSHLKDLNSENKFSLLDFLNSILSSGNIPESWRVFNVIPLRKKGGDPALATSYRSIALASSIRKTFERMLNNRLEWFLESNRKLHPAQSGFRRSKSTKDNILTLWCAIQAAFFNKKFVVATFIDIKGAFDWVNMHIMISILSCCGAPAYFCYLIHFLFFLKILNVQCGDQEVTRYSYTGVPQGSVLSPLLFNIYINNIFINLPSDTHILAYADDIVVFSCNKNVYQAQRAVQFAINIIESRFKTLQLTLSSAKSKSMVFSKTPLRSPMPPPIALSTGPTEYVDNFNFLGIVLHKHLKLDSHLKHLSTSCFHFSNVMRSLCGISWGSDPTCLLRIYTSVIRPKIEYAAPLLLDCTLGQRLKIERLQWKCLRIALGAFPSTHTRALEQLAQIPPLPERLKFLTNNLLNFLLSNPNHPIHPFMQTWTSMTGRKPPFLHLYQHKKLNSQLKLFLRHPMFSYSYESLHYIPPIILLPVKKRQCSAAEVLERFEHFNKGHWSQFQKIYTDGSKTATHCGAGLFFPNAALEAHFNLHQNTTIFTAEAFAISEALGIIALQTGKKFLVVTDSLSVLQALKTFPNNRSHPIIYKIRSVALDLKKNGYIVRFLWVPSHFGIIGNEIADSVASNFVDQDVGDSFTTFSRDLSSVDRLLQVQEWQERWSSSPKGRFLFHISPQVNLKPWFHNLSLPRHVIVTINRLLSNHTNCKDHLFKIDMADNNICSCGDIQTPDHLLLVCGSFDSIHRRKFINTVLAEGQLPINLAHLLLTFNTKIFHAICKFFKDSGIRI